MLVTEISLWGAIIVACLVVVAIIVLAFVDRQMLRRMLVIFGATVLIAAAFVANVLAGMIALLMLRTKSR